MLADTLSRIAHNQLALVTTDSAFYSPGVKCSVGRPGKGFRCSASSFCSVVFAELPRPFPPSSSLLAFFSFPPAFPLNRHPCDLDWDGTGSA